MYTLFTIPSASTLIASTSDYSVGFGSELVLLGLVFVGILLGGMFARRIGSTVFRAVSKIIGGKKGGRRRRR